MKNDAKAKIGQFLANNDLSTFFDLEEDFLKIDRFAIIQSVSVQYSIVQYIEVDSRL